MVESVWIDCDPGHDDAFALLLATQSQGINLLGVSVVHGNDEVDNCARNARRFLWACGASKIPVVAGASRPLVRQPKFCPEIHGSSSDVGSPGLCGFQFPDQHIFKNNIDKSKHAVLEMMHTLIHHDEKVTMVLCGAHTNLALLLRMFPEVSSKISKVVFMGGAVGLGNTGVAAEFNIEIDPEAVHIVLTSGIKAVMIPLEVTHTVLVEDEILDQILSGKICQLDTLASRNTDQLQSPPSMIQSQEMNRLFNSQTQIANSGCHSYSEDDEGNIAFRNATKFRQCCYKLLTFFKSMYKEYFSFAAPPLHDPLTVFYLTHPEAFQTIKVHVDVELSSPKCVGRTLVDVHGMLNKDKNVILCTKVDVPKFWQDFLACLSKADEQSPLNNF